MVEETTTTAKPGALVGWICPRCGAAVSPALDVCPAHAPARVPPAPVWLEPELSAGGCMFGPGVYGLVCPCPLHSVRCVLPVGVAVDALGALG